MPGRDAAPRVRLPGHRLWFGLCRGRPPQGGNRDAEVKAQELWGLWLAREEPSTFVKVSGERGKHN